MDEFNNITQTAAAAEPGKSASRSAAGFARPAAIVSASSAPCSAVLPTFARWRARVCRLQDHPSLCCLVA